MGATASLIPAIIPLASERANIDIAEFLVAVPALFAGLLVGVLASSLIGLLGVERTLVIGTLLQAVGLAVIATVPMPSLFVGAAFVAGVGFGLAEASGSVLARLVAGEGTARLLSLLTGTVAVAAAGFPLLVVFGSSSGWPVIPILVAIAIQVGASYGSASPRLRPGMADRSPSRAEESRATKHSATRRRLGLAAVALFLYVGVETVLAGWSAVIPLQLLAIRPEEAALGTSIFWILMATGRYASWAALRTTATPKSFLVGCVAGAGVMLTLATVSGVETPILTILALCGTVLCLGPIYSLIIGIALSGIDIDMAKRTTGMLIAFGAAGGSLVPAIVVLALN